MSLLPRASGLSDVGVIRSHNAAAPQPLAQALARHDLAGMFEKRRQDLERLMTEPDARTTAQ